MAQFNDKTIPSLPIDFPVLVGDKTCLISANYEASSDLSDGLVFQYRLGDGPWAPVTLDCNYINGYPNSYYSIPIFITGLTNKRTYTVSVRAVYKGTPGEPLTGITFMPTNVDASKIKVKAGNGMATVTFKHPARVNKAPAIYSGTAVVQIPVTKTGKVVQSLIQSSALSGASSIPNLTNGQSYYVLVSGNFSIGEKIGGFLPFAVATVTPQGPPSAPRPTSETASLVNGQATITFDLPVTNGGSKITRYTYSVNGSPYKPIALQKKTDIPTVIIKGVKEGDMITLKAVNAKGASDASIPVRIHVSIF